MGNPSESIRVSEIFGPTIQGEGALIGQPSVFVRTGGCDYQCSWCDTPHAVKSEYRDEWKSMSAEDIWTEVERLSGGNPLMVSLSGGNPAIQPLKPLINLGQAAGYQFAMETQGSVAADWFSGLDVLTLSPKPPSSGMDTDWDKFEDCVQAAADKPEIVLKIVVFDQDDYNYARDVAKKYPQIPLYLQPGNHTPIPQEIEMTDLVERSRWLAEKVTEDCWFEAYVLPQLHVMLWGNLRGV